MHGRVCCYCFLFSGSLRAVVINNRNYRCAGLFINLCVIECDYVKNMSGKTGGTLGYMEFVTTEYFRWFDGGDNKVGIKVLKRGK